MHLEELFQSLVGQASVKSIYGEPISAGGKTIVPVAAIRYGFGGGSGRKGERNEEGFGGGGGFVGKPVGVIEVTDEQTRFIPIHRNRTIALAAAIGFGLGLLAARRVGVPLDRRLQA
jgi:uncharacterized spore protein YtfJ